MHGGMSLDTRVETEEAHGHRRSNQSTAYAQRGCLNRFRALVASAAIRRPGMSKALGGRRIFEPLGMKDTDFSVPSAKLGRFTASYFPNPETGALDLFDGIQDSAWGLRPAFPSGAGGLVSTVDDFLIFARMMLNKGKYGGVQILSARSVEAMTIDQVTPSQKVEGDFFPQFWATRGWGFGVAIVTQPTRCPRCPAATDGMAASARIGSPIPARTSSECS